jgi:uncharacterized membrane protein
MKLVRGETQLLHKTFVVSLIGKAVFGFFELLGAVLSLVVTPLQIQEFAKWLTSAELHEDPSSVIGRFINHLAAGIDTSATHYVAAYLAVHGLIKVVLVFALFRQKMWAYPAMLIALAIFVVTQCIQLATGFSWGLFLLTLFDIFVFYLTRREWNLHRAAVAAAKD